MRLGRCDIFRCRSILVCCLPFVCRQSITERSLQVLLEPASIVPSRDTDEIHSKSIYLRRFLNFHHPGENGNREDRRSNYHKTFLRGKSRNPRVWGDRNLLDTTQWRAKTLSQRVYSHCDCNDFSAAKLDGSKAVRGGIPLVLIQLSIANKRCFRYLPGGKQF
jgi:hypothetical protein